MSSALQILFEQAGERAQQCAKDLARTRQTLAQAQEKLQMLEGYALDKFQSLHQDTLQGVTAYQLRSHAGYLGKIEEAVAQQRREVEFIQRTEEHQVNQWKESLAEEKKYKALLDREALRKAKLENKRDQKMNDEFAARIYRVRTAGESA